MRRWRDVLVILLLARAGAPAIADAVDEYAEAARARQRIPGLSVAVMKEGKIVKAAGYGLANVELNAPAKPETVYKIASVSKQFIATGIVLLAEEGKLDIEDRISEHLPDAPEAWSDVTIRHLLTHTSGIVREPPGYDLLKTKSDAEVIRSAYSAPLRFAPGERYEYCNVGYFILGEIIRKASGGPWSDYLQARVFDPLGMSATRVTTVTEIVPNRAAGYLWRLDKLHNAALQVSVRPSGAFLSNVLDLARWDAALHGDSPLKREARERMWTPVTLKSGQTHPYGLGWGIDSVNGHRVVRHGGALSGFRCEFARFVDDGLSVVVLTNCDSARPGPIAINLAALFVPGLLPERTAIQVEPQLLEKYAGKYRESATVTLTITRSGNRLTLREGMSPEELELLPETATDFFPADDRQATYRFVKDENGQVTHLVRLVNGKEAARAKRL